MGALGRVDGAILASHSVLRTNGNLRCVVISALNTRFYKIFYFFRHSLAALVDNYACC